MPDTPWHIGYAKKKEEEPRRHKARCAYLDKGICKCGRDCCYMERCKGSSHCRHYTEESIEKAEEEQRQVDIEVSVKAALSNYKSRPDIEIIRFCGQRYFKIHFSEEESLMIPYEKNMTKEKMREYIKKYRNKK